MQKFYKLRDWSLAKENHRKTNENLWRLNYWCKVHNEELEGFLERGCAFFQQWVSVYFISPHGLDCFFGPVFNHVLDFQSHQVNSKDKNGARENQTELKVNHHTQNHKESSNGLYDEIRLPPLFEVPQNNFGLISWEERDIVLVLIGGFTVGSLNEEKVDFKGGEVNAVQEEG